MVRYQFLYLPSVPLEGFEIPGRRVMQVVVVGHFPDLFLLFSRYEHAKEQVDGLLFVCICDTKHETAIVNRNYNPAIKLIQDQWNSSSRFLIQEPAQV